ncbi:hypothetical protein CCMA1212_006924 [Trichoderma ghanense]|uniref:Uncharacterized protein n=1 Tax=Trichoderma ghanense TaxID=65468 RepID=A0ABY2H0C8_9HYPO
MHKILLINKFVKPPCLPLPMVYAVIRTFPGSAGFEVQNFLAATPVWLMASADATATFFMMNWALQALDLGEWTSSLS